jgi:hypothetical protein
LTDVQGIQEDASAPSRRGGVGRKTGQSELAKKALRTGAGSGHGRSAWSAPSALDDSMARLDLLDPSQRIEAFQKEAGEFFISLHELPATLEKMSEAMREAARSLQFEKAAELRDRIRRLKVMSLAL